MATATQKVSCLCDEQLLNHNEGRLGNKELAIVEAHLQDCEACKVHKADMQYWDGFMREHVEWSPEDIGAE